MTIPVQRVIFRHRHVPRAMIALVTILAWSLSLGIVAADVPSGPPTGAPAGGPPGGAPPPPSANVSVFATGVQAPRGLRFGPDGNLYVAEGGTGGTNSTAGKCDQVVPPVGPYTGGKTARISKISAAGGRTTVIDGLPSSRDGMGDQSAVSGVADIEFIGTTAYALITGGGCSHGVPDGPNGIVKVNSDGTWSQVADLGAFLKTHPVAKPEAADFEPDGTWYSMVNVGGTLYALEPNHGELDKVTPDGQISRVVDISASQGHIVPTAMVYHDGNFYVGNLSTFPIIGDSKILKITPTGDVSVVATGLSAVLGVAFDSQGRLYALEMSTAKNSGPVPGTGMVVRMTASGSWEPVATGLFFPTAMTFGPDGQLYVSNMGFGPPTGQIVRVNVNAAATTTATTTTPSTSSSTTTTSSGPSVPPAPPVSVPAPAPSPSTPNLPASFTKPSGSQPGAIQRLGNNS